MSRALLSLALFIALGAQSAFAEGPRRFGGLVVESTPQTRSEDVRGRLPYDVEGSLVVGDARTWVGPEVPGHVPLGFEVPGSAVELVRLRPDADGALALYREMYSRGDEPGCAQLSTARSGTLRWENCLVRARYYDRGGALRWELDVSGLYPRKDHLQLVDIVRVGDRVYYNEACATYSAEAGGRCANVVAVDVSGAAPRVVWRSKPLASNTDIVPVGAGTAGGARWLVTGYGFTAERDFMVVLDAERGTVVQKVAVKKAPESIKAATDGAFDVLIYGADEAIRFRLTGAEGKRPRLIALR